MFSCLWSEEQKPDPTNLMKTTYTDPTLICLLVCSLSSKIPHSSSIVETYFFLLGHGKKLYFLCVSEQSH